MRLSTATTATILASSAWLASAADLTFVIPPHPAALPAGASSLPSSTHATLHARGAPLSAPLRRDGTFVFADVAPGSYLLSVHGRDHLFENLRVDVEEAVDYEGDGKDGEKKKGAGKKVEKVRAWQTFRGNEWANRGEKRGESSAKGGEMLAEVRVLGRKEYYQERSGFSPLAFLKNPMILMGVFSLALIVGMPYLMDNSEWISLVLFHFPVPASFSPPLPPARSFLHLSRVTNVMVRVLQWTKRLVPSSRRCRRAARLRKIRRPSCRTST